MAKENGAVIVAGIGEGGEASWWLLLLFKRQVLCRVSRLGISFHVTHSMEYPLVGPWLGLLVW